MAESTAAPNTTDEEGELVTHDNLLEPQEELSTSREEVAELEEKRKWEEFKKEKRTQPKRQRVMDDESLPDSWKEPQHKKLRRMETEVEDRNTLDLSDWWPLVEGMCKRAGMLRKKLLMDKERVLRRMQVLETEKISENENTHNVGGVS